MHARKVTQWHLTDNHTTFSFDVADAAGHAHTYRFKTAEAQEVHDYMELKVQQHMHQHDQSQQQIAPAYGTAVVAAAAFASGGTKAATGQTAVGATSASTGSFEAGAVQSAEASSLVAGTSTDVSDNSNAIIDAALRLDVGGISRALQVGPGSADARFAWI